MPCISYSVRVVCGVIWSLVALSVIQCNECICVSPMLKQRETKKEKSKKIREGKEQVRRIKNNLIKKIKRGI